MAQSRSALINELKRRGVKGSLSKMNKAQLRELHAQATRAATDENATLDVTAGAAATVLPQGGSGISLAPLSIRVARWRPIRTFAPFAATHVLRAVELCIIHCNFIF